MFIEKFGEMHPYVSSKGKTDFDLLFFLMCPSISCLCFRFLISQIEIEENLEGFSLGEETSFGEMVDSLFNMF